MSPQHRVTLYAPFQALKRHTWLPAAFLGLVVGSSIASQVTPTLLPDASQPALVATSLVIAIMMAVFGGWVAVRFFGAGRSRISATLTIRGDTLILGDKGGTTTLAQGTRTDAHPSTTTSYASGSFSRTALCLEVGTTRLVLSSDIAALVPQGAALDRITHSVSNGDWLILREYFLPEARERNREVANLVRRHGGENTPHV